MKDSIITASRKRTELISALVCFCIAMAVNIFSIIRFHTPFYEVFTQIGYTLTLTLILYLLSTLLRLACHLLKKLFRR